MGDDWADRVAQRMINDIENAADEQVARQIVLNVHVLLDEERWETVRLRLEPAVTAALKKHTDGDRSQPVLNMTYAATELGPNSANKDS